jgi:hypothetical protein
MGKPDSGRQAAALTLAALLLLPTPATAADLRANTLEAFNHYVERSEASMEGEAARGPGFLRVDRLPEAQRDAAHESLRQGKVAIERLETLDGGKRIAVPGGMIHHWIGTVFIPGATLAKTLELVEDYDHHQEYYKPDVMRSKILRHEGNEFLVALRFYKKRVLTSVLETQHEIHYFPLDATHATSRSRTTSIREVENAAEADEQVKPEGHDRGLLWRMNTYWRFEEKDGGTYVECQSISLTRDIPTGLGWLLNGYVESVPRESLTFTLCATRTTLLQRLHGA